MIRFLKYSVLVSILNIQNISAQVLITTPIENAISPFTNQAVVGQAPPNLPVQLLVNGVVVDSSHVRVDGVFEFLGVRCSQGPVTFTATVTMKNGKTFSAERKVHILGDPDSLAVTCSSNEIQGDGRSTIAVSVEILDRWKVRIPTSYFITVEVDHLEVLEEDIDANTPGHQVRLTDGAANFTLRSSDYVGPVTLSLSTNSIVRKENLYAITPSIPFMLVGSADGTLKSLATKGETAGLVPSEDFSSGFQKQGRVAAIGRGNVFGNYLLTLSLDTDRKLQDKIFRDLDPNSLYSMYGDNSIVTYEAQSTSPLFAKLEKNQSYLMYGDFNTQMTTNEFAAYNRSFTGAKIHSENLNATIDAFGTVTNRKVAQEEVRGLGISGFYYLKQNNIVTGSEKVRIEVRDRFHSEIVTTVKEKSRYSDYEIDYVQGSLYFKQPIPSLDDQSNPVYIVLSYEAITNTADNTIVGGAGGVTFMDAITFGVSSVVEQREPKNYVLLGGSAAFKLSSIGKINGEAARSSDVSGKGSAWKLEAEIAPWQSISVRPYFRKIDGTFSNVTQSGSGREVGTTKYGSTVQLDPLSGMTLIGDFYNQLQTQGTFATEIRSLGGSVRQAFTAGHDITVKVEDVKYNGENPEVPTQNLSTHSTLLSSRVNATIIDGLTASGEYEHNLRPAEKDVRPNAVGVGLEYRINTAISVYALQKFLEGQGRLTTVGVNTQLNEGTSVYGRYEIGNAISGERNAAAIGLKNSLKVTNDLTTNFLYEKSKNLSKKLAEARTDDHDALSVSLEYLPTFPLRATVKGEYSEDPHNLRKGFDFGASYKLANDFSVITKATNYLAVSRSQTGNTSQQKYMLGFAYRPTATNWLNVIGKIEHKVQDNTVVQPAEYYRTTIASAHAYLEPFPLFEIGLKYALKNAFEQYDGVQFATLTDFILLRPQYDVTEWLNVAGEMRMLRQRGANDLKVGYSAETGVVAMKNMIVAVGYNFQAYKDRDLVDYIYSVAGPYVTIRMKFTEETFGLETSRTED